MNINIYIEDQLARQLSTFSQKFHRKRNSIVREAIREWLEKHTSTKWPKSILEFEGIKDFPDISELRKGPAEKEKKLF
ncbi:ribbon-helix-helix domain-containing protein [Rickettsiaceae bacterium]|nr:ribbon-helix-helix domain-containing protein [Rickettsiaceae bacterium]